MSNFINFKKAVANKIKEMEATGLFSVGYDKDTLWNLYLDSFPEGTNKVFRERREYDCSCCRGFIKNIGGAVTIVDNKLVSVWDIDVGGYYQPVVDALSAYVKSLPIVDVYKHYENKVGTDKNVEMIDGVAKEWNHFYVTLPQTLVMGKHSIASYLGEVRETKNVWKRGLEEITKEAIDTVLELIDQKSLYRGEEHVGLVKLLSRHKAKYSSLKGEEKDLYAWSTSIQEKAGARVRNTVIGTLLVDLSDGVELDAAVRSFEQKVAPANYKRPTALVSKAMIKKAQEKVIELGIEPSLDRRFAKKDDITINNVIFASRSAKKAMNVFDELANEAPAGVGNLSKVEEIGIEEFIKSVVPKATEIEVLFENKHKNNLVSLIAPSHKDSKGIFKWGNNFSWSYNNEMADSMKERVKAAGGNVEGVLRFSIQWNDNGDNLNDLDAHCKEPGNNEIYFGQKRGHKSSGTLDVDIIRPQGVAVENIIYTDKNRMPEGNYVFFVNNYSDRGGKGFSAQVEFDGQIFEFNYPQKIRSGGNVEVAVVNYSKKNGFSMVKSLDHSKSTVNVWGINTNNWHKVSMLMNSPNHWDGESVGNKHWFFMLDKCENPDPARGFYNEFLSSELNEHRKVFEVLASKMKAQPTTDQLSGVGFSSTQRNSVCVKVTGTFSRVLKVNF